MEKKLASDIANESDEQVLKEALDEIKETIKDTSNAKKADGTLASVITLYGKYLDALNECHNFRYGPVSEESLEEIKCKLSENWNFSEEDLNRQYSARQYVPHFRMHKFYAKYAMFGLSDKPKTVALLPYLLSAFYLNINFDNGAPADVTDLCDKDLKENRYRNIDAFIDRLSLKKPLEKFFKNKKSDQPRPIRSIKNKETYIEFLKYPKAQGHSTKLKDYKLSDLHYQNIIRALIYSTSVLACLHTSSICDQVDYQKSFELFIEHTSAFYTACFFAPPWYDDEGMMDGKELRKEYTTQIYLYLVNKRQYSVMKQRIHENYEHMLSQERKLLKDCGLSTYKVGRWEDYPSKKWYINAATLSALMLNPLFFLYEPELVSLP